MFLPEIYNRNRLSPYPLQIIYAFPNMRDAEFVCYLNPRGFIH